jgi:hypothetical protein
LYFNRTVDHRYQIGVLKLAMIVMMNETTHGGAPGSPHLS